MSTPSYVSALVTMMKDQTRPYDEDAIEIKRLPPTGIPNHFPGDNDYVFTKAAGLAREFRYNERKPHERGGV